MHQIPFRARLTTRWLFAALGVLVLLNLFLAFGQIVLHWRLGALMELVNMDMETNLPTLFSILLILFSALLFHLHGRMAQGKSRRGWVIMSAAFLFLGIDEGSQIHEKFRLVTAQAMDRWLGTGDMGWLENAWVIPYALAGLTLVVLVLPWLMGLDRKLLTSLVISGAVYVVGAIFFELAAGSVVQSDFLRSPSNFPWMPCELIGEDACWLYMDPQYVAMYMLEEIFETTGLILCARALLNAFEANGQRVFIAVQGGAAKAMPH